MAKLLIQFNILIDTALLASQMKKHVLKTPIERLKATKFCIELAVGAKSWLSDTIIKSSIPAKKGY